MPHAVAACIWYKKNIGINCIDEEVQLSLFPYFYIMQTSFFTAHPPQLVTSLIDWTMFALRESRSLIWWKQCLLDITEEYAASDPTGRSFHVYREEKGEGGPQILYQA